MSSQLRKDLNEVLSTAWPLMLSTGLFSLTLFVDRMLLFRYSASSAAAAMGAGTILWTINCMPIGVCGYTNTFVAQYLSAKRPTRALQVVWQGILLAVGIGPILAIFGYNAELLFSAMGHSENLAHQEAEYFVWLIPGTWASIIASALVGLFSGSGRSMILLYTDMVVSVVNAVLDYVMIFGLLGCPELGVKGAAIASSIALILKLVILAYVARKDFQLKNKQAGVYVDPETLGSNRAGMAELLKWDFPLMRRLIHFGWPAGVSVVAEAICFTTIMMIVGQIGEDEADATTLALGVNLIAFIPLVGLGTATGVLVAKYLVREQIETARRMVFSGLLIGIAYSMVFVILYGGFPDSIMMVYALDTDPKRFEAMRPMLRPLLYFIAGYCVFDAFQTVFVGALKGAGDTRFVLGGHIVAGATTVIGGIWINRWTGLGGLYYWWWVIAVWVFMLAVIFTARYLHGGWQTKRVIEPTVAD
jgi:multidrug resistance protein, MATE family